MTSIDAITLDNMNILHADISRSVMDSMNAIHGVGDIAALEQTSKPFAPTMLDSLSENHLKAEQAVANFSRSGSQLDYTEAVLAVSKLREEMALYATLRDKMVQAYQQLLHMQI